MHQKYELIKEEKLGIVERKILRKLFSPTKYPVTLQWRTWTNSEIYTKFKVTL